MSEQRSPTDVEWRFNCLGMAIDAEVKFQGLTESASAIQSRILDNAKAFYAYVNQSDITKRDEDNAAYFHDGWLAACKEVALQMEHHKPEDVDAWVTEQINRNSPVDPEYTDRVKESMEQAKAGMVEEHDLDYLGTSTVEVDPNIGRGPGDA